MIKTGLRYSNWKGFVTNEIPAIGSIVANKGRHYVPLSIPGILLLQINANPPPAY